jgi:hypothetical protein
MKTILIFSPPGAPKQTTLVLSVSLASFIGFAQVQDTTTVNKLDEVVSAVRVGCLFRL